MAVPSGGPITHDNTNAETYCTIYAIAEVRGRRLGPAPTTVTSIARRRRRVVGRRRQEHRGVPAHAIVASIETSAITRVAYVTFDAHRLGDTHPYIFTTRDGGSSWTRIDAGCRSGLMSSAKIRATVVAFCRYRGRPVGLVRSRRALARFALGDESRAGLRSADSARCERPDRGHAWPRLCDPRRPRSARKSGARGAGRSRAVYAGRCLALHVAPVLRYRAECVRRRQQAVRRRDFVLSTAACKTEAEAWAQSAAKRR